MNPRECRYPDGVCEPYPVDAFYGVIHVCRICGYRVRLEGEPRPANDAPGNAPQSFLNAMPRIPARPYRLPRSPRPWRDCGRATGRNESESPGRCAREASSALIFQGKSHFPTVLDCPLRIH